ncbi:MAG: hypothetical protein J5544_01780 [Clostridia bacterium]|nr:hypothetical protein [Clostridia bacterium]
MSNKTSRNLQCAAVILFGIALILTIVSIFAQAPLKGFINSDPEIGKITSVPWMAIVSIAFRLILSIICLLVIAGKPSRGGAIALTIVSAILLILSAMFIEPALGMVFTRLVSRSGANTLISYNALSSVVSMLTGVFSAPASVLMLLSLGGCIPKKQ